MSFITSSYWIKRGVAKANPDKIQLSREELKQLIRTNVQEATAPDVLEESVGDDEYNFENYDNEDGTNPETVFGLGTLATYDDSDGDPHVNLPDMDAESESDIEDEKILPNDNLILVGQSDKDYDVIKVYVYNESNDDVYVHHDIILTSCPLSFERIPLNNAESSNLAAVGLLSPVIEVWDIDVINTLEPVGRLGFKSKKRFSSKNYGHKKGVLDLSWNPNFEHILASSSADESVILWDLDSFKPSTVIRGFGSCVENVKWHSVEGHALLTSCTSGSVRLYDCRYDQTFKSWTIDGEAGVARWNPWNLYSFLIGSSTGKLYEIDSRMENQVCWERDFHSDHVASLEFAPPYQGLTVSSSVDGVINFVNITGHPELVGTKTVDVGQLHTVSLNPDAPYIGCIGGTKKSNKFKMLNMKSIQSVTDKWPTMLSVENL